MMLARGVTRPPAVTACAPSSCQTASRPRSAPSWRRPRAAASGAGAPVGGGASDCGAAPCVAHARLREGRAGPVRLDGPPVKAGHGAYAADDAPLPVAPAPQIRHIRTQPQAARCEVADVGPSTRAPGQRLTRAPAGCGVQGCAAHLAGDRPRLRAGGALAPRALSVGMETARSSDYTLTWRHAPLCPQRPHARRGAPCTAARSLPRCQTHSACWERARAANARYERAQRRAASWSAADVWLHTGGCWLCLSRPPPAHLAPATLPALTLLPKVLCSLAITGKVQTSAACQALPVRWSAPAGDHRQGAQQDGVPERQPGASTGARTRGRPCRLLRHAAALSRAATALLPRQL